MRLLSLLVPVDAAVKQTRKYCKKIEVTQRQSTYSLFIRGNTAGGEGAKALKYNGSWVIAHCE